MGKIILASSSPRRRDLLNKANLKFEIIPSPYIEDHTTTVFSYEFIEGLAANKALAVVPLVTESSIIIGADTVVVDDNIILGKPKDRKDAFNTLKRLSGKTHIVVTGMAAVNSKTHELKTISSTSHVTFEKLTDEQIYYYLDKFKPYDKAGSYGIQELDKSFIKEIKGEFDNIVGLPTKMLINMLEEINYKDI